METIIFLLYSLKFKSYLMYKFTLNRSRLYALQLSLKRIVAAQLAFSVRMYSFRQGLNEKLLTFLVLIRRFSLAETTAFLLAITTSR